MLKEFRNDFFEHLITFLWRQWTALGISGSIGVDEEWILDPEPLLIFSLEVCRYEPRLFDEILGWLTTNEEILDIHRLKNLALDISNLSVLRTVGGAVCYLSEASHSRKWNGAAKFFLSLSEDRLKKENVSVEPLFKLQDGNPHPLAPEGNIEPGFMRFRLNRHGIKVLRPTREVPINAQSNLRFMLRSIFGMGAKSECVLYLLTHDGGHPADIAKASGFSWLSLRDALEDLKRSGLALTRPTGQGKREEYWLSQKKWWEFINYGGEEAPRTRWLDWIAVYSALAQLWRVIDHLAEGKESEYMRNSKLQESLAILSNEFSRAGLDVSWMPNLSVPTDTYLQSALTVLSRMFNLPSPAAITRSEATK